MAKRWYVVHVYSGFEKKIAQQIKEQAEQKGLSDHIEEVLVPSEEVIEVRRGQKVNSERKFFPGYVLVKMEMSDDAWHLVKNTPKVTGFLGNRMRPSPITSAEAEQIMKHPFFIGKNLTNDVAKRLNIALLYLLSVLIKH